MAVIVSFIKTKSVVSIHAQAVGSARAREDVTPSGTTTAAAQVEELIYVGNDEDNAVCVAWGSAPDADATAATAATSAGIYIPAGGTATIVPATGDKLNVKAAS